MKDEPAYKTVAASLREEIRAGAFPPTRRLPTDAELGETFSVSRQTVRHAFDQLVGEGLVYRVPGRGSFAVASPAGGQYLRSVGSVDDLLALSVDTELEVIRPFAVAVDVAAAGRLRLPTDRVSVGVFRRLHQELPFALTTFYLPPEVGARIGGDLRLAQPGVKSPATIIQVIEETCNIPIAGAHQSITAAIADPEVCELIDVAPGNPVLIVELAVSSFNVSRYSYRLQLRRTIG
jgi:GntR family transcriptional regulator